MTVSLFRVLAELCTDAQAWADSMAQANNFNHEPGISDGENLSWFSTGFFTVRGWHFDCWTFVTLESMSKRLEYRQGCPFPRCNWWLASWETQLGPRWSPWRRRWWRFCKLLGFFSTFEQRFSKKTANQHQMWRTRNVDTTPSKFGKLRPMSAMRAPLQAMEIPM